MSEKLIEQIPKEFKVRQKLTCLFIFQTYCNAPIEIARKKYSNTSFLYFLICFCDILLHWCLFEMLELALLV